jgi:hypothetical protein
VINKSEETNRVSPPRIRIEKLVIKTFILGTALPRTANETLTIKFKAIKGAEIKVPIMKTWFTSFTNSRVGLALRKKAPIGRISKLMIKALRTS